MIFVLASWLILFAGLCGIGALTVYPLRHLSEWRWVSQLNLFRLFWVGTATTIALAQIWNFFFRLGSWPLSIWMLAAASGILLLTLSRLSLFQQLLATLTRRQVIKLSVFAFCVLFLLYLGMTGVATWRWSHVYDSDLYHFNAVRWMNEYATVPGLGNLHSRLAHTSGFLLLAALFDNLWWDRATAWVLYGLFISVVSFQWLWLILAPLTKVQSYIRFFCLLTLPYLLQLQTTIHPTLYYDEIAMVLQLVLVAELLAWIPLSKQVFRGHEKPAKNLPEFLIIALLGALCFSMKPIGAISLLFVVVLALIVVARSWRHAQLLRSQVIANAVIVSAVPLTLLVGHVVRNAVLAGWLLFPAPLGRLDLDWAMPREPVSESHAAWMQSVEGQYKVIKAWARLPGPNFQTALSGNTSAWLLDWRRRHWQGVERDVFYMGVLFWMLHFLSILRRQIDPAQVTSAAVLMLLAAANLIFWFNSAPDMRFGRVFFWIWMGSGGALLLTRIRLHAALSFGLLALYLTFAVVKLPISLRPHRPECWRSVGRAKPLRTAAHAITPQLTVHVPVAGDQCGDSALPATPYPLKTLVLREPGALQSGFRHKAKK